MRNSSNDKKSPADPAAAHFEMAFYPYRDDTAVAVTLVRGLGARAVRMGVWRGHLPCTRGDLRGLGAGHVALLLSGQLWDSLDRAHDRSLTHPGEGTAEGPGAPSGGHRGEGWTQPTLDFLTP